MLDPSLPDARVIRELLSYDPETGVLTWKPRPTDGLSGHALTGTSAFNTRYAGTVAGGRAGLGYIRVRVLGKGIWAHRLAWLLTCGRWPSSPLDHVNGVRIDNRFVNLREAPGWENNRNKCGRPNNTGFPGVSRKGRRFKACIKVNGTRIRLGSFSTPELAHAAYRKALLDHGFDPLHSCTAAERAARSLPGSPPLDEAASPELP